MANRYANLVGSNKIKDEYTKINTGFDTIQAEVDAINTELDEKADRAFAQVNDLPADTKDDTLTIEGGTGITITTNPNEKKVIVTATGTATPGAHGSAHTEFGADPIQLATTTEGGLMSASDKAKLDAATSAATPNAIIQRDVSGRAKVAEPSDADDIATKGYADNTFLRRSGGTIVGELAIQAPGTNLESAINLIDNTEIRKGRLFYHLNLDRVVFRKFSPSGEIAADLHFNESEFMYRIGSTYYTVYHAANAGPFYKGSGSPEGVVTAPVGSIYQRTDGSAGSTLYVKRSGTGNTGWFAVA